MTLKKLLFSNHSSVSYWKVDFTLYKDQYAKGMTSITFLINSLPFGGNCYVDNYNGTCLSTLFNIRCINWKDSDGIIVRYEYMGKFFK